MALTGALWLFLARTDLGRTMRAAADNPYGARVIGADVRSVYGAAFGIGAACVGAAGALVSPILPFQPTSGLGLSVASFNIVIIGGMGSLPGAFAGGILVSVAESMPSSSPSMKGGSFGLTSPSCSSGPPVSSARRRPEQAQPLPPVGRVGSRRAPWIGETLRRNRADLRVFAPTSTRRNIVSGYARGRSPQGMRPSSGSAAATALLSMHAGLRPGSGCG
jgi:hypothetical protein